MISLFKTKTRIKLTYVLLGLGLIEALLKVIMTSFPFAELLTFNGLVAGGYFGAKWASGNSEAKYDKLVTKE